MSGPRVAATSLSLILALGTGTMALICGTLLVINILYHVVPNSPALTNAVLVVLGISFATMTVFYGWAGVRLFRRFGPYAKTLLGVAAIHALFLLVSFIVAIVTPLQVANSNAYRTPQQIRAAASAQAIQLPASVAGVEMITVLLILLIKVVVDERKYREGSMSEPLQPAMA